MLLSAWDDQQVVWVGSHDQDYFLLYSEETVLLWRNQCQYVVEMVRHRMEMFGILREAMRDEAREGDEVREEDREDRQAD